MKLDLRGEICPFTFVRTKLALEELPLGSGLEIFVNHAPAADNVPRSLLAEGHEVVTLARKESPYAELYVDLVKRCGSMLDAHPWLAGEDAFGVDAALRQVRDAADQAVDEFDKVHRLQREAVQQLTDIRRRCEERFRLLRRASFTRLEEFVENLSALRRLRGDLVSLKEVRYIDLPRIEESEQAVAAQADQLARGCVKFLLQPVALDPYRRQAEAQLAAVDQVARVAEGRKIEKAVAVTVNDPALTERMVAGLKRAVGEANVKVQPRVMVAEDFSYFQQQVPGLFYFVGVTPRDQDMATAPPNHSPRFYVDESALVPAARSLAALAVDFLTGR